MILFNKLQGREYVHTLKAKEKMMRKKYILIISIALLLVAGCSHKTNNPENKSENVNVSNQKENESTEINNIVDVKLKSVKYTGSYDNRFLGTSDDKVYLFDANGQILNEYSNDNYPTEFFYTIYAKRYINSAKQNAYYKITDINGNDISYKYIKSDDKFYNIYLVDKSPMILATIFEENPTSSVAKLVFKDVRGDIQYSVSTDDESLKSNKIDVKYFKSSTLKVDYIGDGIIYLKDMPYSYFINIKTKEVFKDTYQAHSSYINGYMSYRSVSGNGILDVHGNQVLGSTSKALDCTYSNGVYYNYKDKKFYDLDGNTIIDLSEFDVESSDKYSGISAANKLEEYVFDEYGYCNIVIKNPSGKKYYGIINKNGEWIKELQSTEIRYKKELYEDVILYEDNEGYKVYDIKSKKDIGITMTSTNQTFVKDNFFKENYIDIKDCKIYLYNFKENKSKILELFKL